MQAGVSEYVRRAVSSPKISKEVDENKVLRKQLNDMKDEIAELRQLVAELKEDKRRLKYTDDDTVAELKEHIATKDKKIEELMTEREEDKRVHEALRKHMQEEESRKKKKHREIYEYNKDAEYTHSDTDFPPLGHS